jgi:tight adherence protein C
MPVGDPTWLLYVALACSFLAAVVFVAGVGVYVSTRRDRVTRRLVEAAGVRRGQGPVPAIPFSGAWFRQRIEGMLGSLSQWNEPKEELEKSHLRRRLSQAGYRGQGALRIYMGTKVALLFLLGGVGVVVASLLRGVSMTMMASVVLSFCAAGFYLPNLVVSSRAARRRDHLNRVLPDMVDLLVICMEAGMALSAALKKVSEEIHVASPAMREELSIVLLELETGLARSAALQNLSHRTGVEDIHHLAGMLIQADKFGTSIARSLRVFSDAMRTRRTQRAEEAAAKTPVKLTIPLIINIFPALFVVILAPACIQVFTRLFGPSGAISR